MSKAEDPKEQAPPSETPQPGQDPTKFMFWLFAPLILVIILAVLFRKS